MLTWARAVERRDWRLAALAGCCSSLGCACLLLAACSGIPLRTPTAQVHAPALTPEPIGAPAISLAPLAATGIPSPWQRLRDRFAMPGCDYSPMVSRFAATIAANPRNLNAAFKQAMPFILVVTEQIEKYDMPGEFAFLPWVESSYTMIPARGDGVAGMWQLMPRTARELGLRIDAEYDGRLDVYASSRTALVLLKQYKEEFGDWRLADMAFNAGENGVKHALGNRHSITPVEIARLRLNATTYEHLTKLLALACIVSAPERFHVELPEPAADDVLALLELPAPIDLRLVAQLAHMDMAQLRRWNPAYLKSRMPDGGPFHLLVPAARQAEIERVLGMLPQYVWRDWRETKLQQAQSMDTLGMAYDLDARALAAINGVDASASLTAGTRVLLPAHADNGVAALAAEPSPSATASTSTTGDTQAGTCMVRSGDTLWQLARRYGVRVEDLLQWNRLPRNTTLRLG
ncbi:MAG: transglycosylase SLT domain-containing protein, partial [Rudaea sp.]